MTPPPGRRPRRGTRSRPVRQVRPIEGITYPPDLPVSERREEIRELVRDHQVVIVSGETGSGKTTQLPKICLELGRGLEGMIGHTQPRRIAARAVAERLAEELRVPLGGPVGYAVRFSDQVGPDTLVKVMTDGILLAELQRDRALSAYDTLIVDEAHERSLNIDFILGYLKSLLPRRPDLKVIVTSATIDTGRFSAHFDGAPVVEVTGRTYPVEVRYQPLEDEDSEAGRDQVQAVCDAVLDLGQEGPGDILVFLSGEREIRDTAEALRRMDLDGTEILPLYARLSTAEQHRVFRSHPGRRVVLSTNVAETSLTVPGIRYVVDAGMARVSRYNRRTKVQRLPIEPVSQASANQRSGRCGRLGPGICVRLYSEEDFEARPAFTDPEILRTNLAAVILQMAAIGLGDVAGFPFVDPPDARNIRDGVDLLEELGALQDSQAESGRLLTPIGRRLARLPVDPRLGRMVLEAERNDCIREVVVIAAALSIQDPRERPVDKRQAAEEFHARFRHPGSDFLTFLNLWNYLQETQESMSSSQFRRLCRREFLSYQRVREWQDVTSQLRQICRELGLRPNATPASPDVIHRSLLAGLLTHVGMWDPQRRDYLGARNAHWAVAPGSSLHRGSTRWVMAGELVETSRLWARSAAGIRPEWIEPLAGHLVKRSYGEPYWDGRRAAGTVEERVTLYGIPIVAGRRVSLSRVDPAGARDMFIQHALVEGDWTRQYDFMVCNAGVLDEAHRLEEKARRTGVVAGDAELFDFFDERLPASVASGDGFDRWWRKQDDPQRFDFSLALLVGDTGVDPAAYPDAWRQGRLSLALSYKFDPRSDDDGASVHIPVPVLEQVSGEGFDWHVPAFREELVTALIRSLPKALRRHFVPAPDHARAFLARAGPDDGPLLGVLSRFLTGASGVSVPPGSWDLGQLSGYLRLNFRVEDPAGTVLGTGPDLAELKLTLARRARTEVAAVFSALEVRGVTAFEWQELPGEVAAGWKGQTVLGYPALVDRGEHVDLRVYANPEAADSAMWSGTRRLLMLNTPGVTRA
ncbi:MAG: ATP-dependent RNA helicase HrpA, partial [Acidimicrobiales bacterium]